MVLENQKSEQNFSVNKKSISQKELEHSFELESSDTINLEKSEHSPESENASIAKIDIDNNKFWPALLQNIKLALPYTIGAIISNTVSIGRTLIISGVNTDYLAASGLLDATERILVGIPSSFMYALAPLVAGENNIDGDKKNVGKLLNCGLLLGLAIIIPSTVLSLFLEPILIALHQPAIPSKITQQFYQTAWPYIPLMVVFKGYQQFLLGISKPGIVLASNVFNSALTNGLGYIFVYGKFGVPVMGAMGMGYAFSIGYFTSSTVLTLYILLNPQFKHYQFINFTGLKEKIKNLLSTPFKRNQLIDFADFKKNIKNIVKSGGAAVIMVASEILNYSVSILMVGGLGQTALAAQQAVVPLAVIATTPFLANSQSLSVLVADAVKNRHFHKVKRLVQAGIFQGVILAIVIACLFFSISKELMSLFFNVNDPQNFSLIEVAKPLFYITGAGIIVDAIRMSYSGGLRGTLDFRDVIGSSLGMVCGVGLLLGYLLCYPAKLGVNGIYIARDIAMILGVLWLSYSWTKRSNYMIEHQTGDLPPGVNYFKKAYKYMSGFFHHSELPAESTITHSDCKDNSKTFSNDDKTTNKDNNSWFTWTNWKTKNTEKEDVELPVVTKNDTNSQNKM